MKLTAEMFIKRLKSLKSTLRANDIDHVYSRWHALATAHPEAEAYQSPLIDPKVPIFTTAYGIKHIVARYYLDLWYYKTHGAYAFRRHRGDYLNYEYESAENVKKAIYGNRRYVYGGDEFMMRDGYVRYFEPLTERRLKSFIQVRLESADLYLIQKQLAHGERPQVTHRHAESYLDYVTSSLMDVWIYGSNHHDRSLQRKVNRDIARYKLVQKKLRSVGRRDDKVDLHRLAPYGCDNDPKRYQTFTKHQVKNAVKAISDGA